MAGCVSNISKTICRVPLGCILGPFLFLICIYRHHIAIKDSIFHCSADDTNLLNLSKSIKTIPKKR